MKERSVTLTGVEWGLIMGSLVFRAASEKDDPVASEIYNLLQHKIFRQLQMPEKKRKEKHRSWPKTKDHG